MNTIESAIEILRRFPGRVFRTTVRLMAAFPSTRSLLNAVYLKLSLRQKAYFHELCCELFCNDRVRGRGGTWAVDFAGRRLLMPLDSGQFWLDWESAVSIVGHDVAVKETYEALIVSDEVDLFVDVGANYGTHSLLFLVHGVPTISFEPNRLCHETFTRMCEINRVSPTLFKVALGATEKQVTLTYPRSKTWLGSVNGEVAVGLGESEEVVREVVKQRRLDDCLAGIEAERMLLKIDTEGNELAVIEGAMQTIRRLRPRIVIECWKGEERNRIFDAVTEIGYSILPLPWAPDLSREPMSRERFLDSAADNFIAVPPAVKVR